VSSCATRHGPPPTFAARLTTGIAAATAPATKAAAQSRLILESISSTSFARLLMRRGSEEVLTAPYVAANGPLTEEGWADVSDL